MSKKSSTITESLNTKKYSINIYKNETKVFLSAIQKNPEYEHKLFKTQHTLRVFLSSYTHVEF